MKIKVDLKAEKLIVDDKLIYPISCNVRTLANGKRAINEVVRCIPYYMPYDPVTFPAGIWQITGLEWQKDKGFNEDTYGPVKILTNAKVLVNLWQLDEYGDYLRKTDKQVWDTCYWLHYSTSSTTLGCIRFPDPDSILTLARLIEPIIANRETIPLEVI